MTDLLMAAPHEQSLFQQLTLNGLWKNNPALVQLLGLCPLLAVTASTVNALGLAAATLFVLIVSNTAVSLIRTIVSDTIRLPVFVMIIAAAVTVTELLMQAYSYELYQILGIFLAADHNQLHHPRQGRRVCSKKCGAGSVV